MVIIVPDSFGMIDGLSRNVGAYPCGSAWPSEKCNYIYFTYVTRFLILKLKMKCISIINVLFEIFSTGFTFKVECNIGIGISEWIESIATPLTAIFCCWIYNSHRHKICIFFAYSFIHRYTSVFLNHLKKKTKKLPKISYL